MAFASAGAKHIALVGRNESNLATTADRLPSTVRSSRHAMDVLDEASCKEVANAIGAWDVLIMSAGYFSTASQVQASESGDWWRSFEVSATCTNIHARRPVELARYARICRLKREASDRMA